MKPDHRVHGIVEGKNWAPNSTLVRQFYYVFHIDEPLHSHPRLRKNEVVRPCSDRRSAEGLAGPCHQVLRVRTL